jgi:hypothetical protein
MRGEIQWDTSPSAPARRNPIWTPLREIMAARKPTGHFRAGRGRRRRSPNLQTACRRRRSARSAPGTPFGRDPVHGLDVTEHVVFPQDFAGVAGQGAQHASTVIETGGLLLGLFARLVI